MSLMDVEPRPVSEIDDDSTINTAVTPPETTAGDLLADEDPLGDSISSTSVPWPGSTFIIRSVLTGRLLTLLDGQVVLAPPGGRGSIHWKCVEEKGWLGFRNTISGRFLGHNKNGRLCCVADRQQGWENFCVRMTPDENYVLLMTHFERLWKVGLKVEGNGAGEKLVKMNAVDAEKGKVEWDFIKV